MERRGGGPDQQALAADPGWTALPQRSPDDRVDEFDGGTVGGRLGIDLPVRTYRVDQCVGLGLFHAAHSLQTPSFRCGPCHHRGPRTTGEPGFLCTLYAAVAWSLDPRSDHRSAHGIRGAVQYRYRLVQGHPGYQGRRGVPLRDLGRAYGSGIRAGIGCRGGGVGLSGHHHTSPGRTIAIPSVVHAFLRFAAHRIRDHGRAVGGG